jgi:uncharacterized protein (DUF362 family)
MSFRAAIRVGLAAFSIDQGTRFASNPYDNVHIMGELVRMAMLEAGFGQKNPNLPLADLIEPDMTVLLKPNWVLHYNQSGLGMESMVTHPALILAVVTQALKCRPRRVIIGDAPIQGCNWSELVSGDFLGALEGIDHEHNVRVVDFRRTVSRKESLADGVETEVRSKDNFVLFDLGADSLLEPISSPMGRFRVTMYDPRRLAETHSLKKHRYLLCREAFDSDVTINLPKLKTHRKAGLTGALKNVVGLNGNKDYLPHHRVGGTAWGGDCYSGVAPLKRLAEVFLDLANQNIGSPAYAKWSRRAYQVLNWQRHFGITEIEGAWHGNDTVWRMVLDLNRILVYGRRDGTMSAAPQRQIWSLTDAIVCGQGEGPLAAEPISVGALTFSGSSAAADMVHAALLGLDAQKIPLLRESMANFRWPLVPDGVRIQTYFRGRMLSLSQVSQEIGVRVKPPSGWVGYCEMEPRQ